MYSDNSIIPQNVQSQWHILPIHSVVDGQCTCCKKTCDKQGKHPATPHGVKDAKPNYIVDGRNIGLACGEQSGVWCVDADDHVMLPALEKVYGTLPRTWTVKTGSGTTH